MDLDLNLIKCFKTVAEAGSISEASKKLHLSQPAISLQIKKLEEQTKKKLFDRHNRGLVLTPFGKDILQAAHKLREVELDLRQLITDSPEKPSGIIRVGTYTTASSYLLAAPVTQFLREHTTVGLSYTYTSTDEIISQIKGYDLDCGIITDAPEDKHIEAVEFYRDELALVRKTDKKKTKKISAKDLSQLEFLSYPLRYDLCYRKVEQRFGHYLAKARTVLESESFDTLKQMLIEGAGVTFIPRYLVEKEINNGKLEEIQIQNSRLPIVFSFLTKKYALLSKPTLALRTAVIDSFNR